jgi:hypothetical protein
MDPEKLKEWCPHKFHRKESLFPHVFPHQSLRELVNFKAPGAYDVMPCKGRGHKGTAIRVWRRHVNVADRIHRRREIHALWEMAVRDVLGADAPRYTFHRVEHEAYIIYYCIGIDIPLHERWRDGVVKWMWDDLTPEDKLFLFRVQNGYYYAKYDFT